MEVPTKQYTLYRRRYAILALYSLSNALNGMLWVSFSPIFQASATLFGVNATAINFFSTVFLFAYIPGALSSVYTMERFGLRWCLVAGAALNAACGWTRYVGSLVALSSPVAGFAIAMLGQIIGALAQPVFSNSPARISGDWFAVHERDTATTVGALSNLIGTAVGAVIPGFAVSGPGDIQWWLLGQAVASVAFLTATSIWVRDRPPTSPSASVEWRDAARNASLSSVSASAAGEAATAASPLPDIEAASPRSLQPATPAATEEVALFQPTSASPRPTTEQGVVNTASRKSKAEAAVRALWIDACILVRNYNFLLLVGAYSIGVGLFGAIITLSGQIIAPCGYGSDIAGYAGGVLLVAGLCGSAIMCFLMKRTRQYVLLQKVDVVIVAGSVVFLLASLVSAGDGALQLLVAFGVTGFFIVPLLPVSYESAAEATFPVPEDTSGAVLSTMSSMLGIVFIFAMPPLLDYPASVACSSAATPFAAFVLVNVIISVGLMLAFRADPRRKTAEAKAEADRKAARKTNVVSELAREEGALSAASQPVPV